MSVNETPVVQVVRFDVNVDYHQAYLMEDGADYPSPAGNASHPVGLIHVTPGSALLTFGVQWGPVGFTVAVADRDPGVDLDAYQDIVEISYESPTGRITLEEWGGSGSHALPPLPAGPGTYRLRHHASGMDEEDAADGMEEHYFLQIWPAPPSDPVVLKSTSDAFRYWLEAERSGT